MKKLLFFLLLVPCLVFGQDLDGVNLYTSGVIEHSGTSYLKVPSGTTAQRPGSPANAMFRYNSSNDKFEAYEDGEWKNVITTGLSISDPGADRGLFWDDSEDGIGYFDLSTGLSFSGTTLALHSSLQAIASGTDIAVADGGTGRSSATAYALIAGGTTSTGAFQSISGLGTSGQVLTSNGAAALPTFQDAASGGWQISGTPANNQILTATNSTTAQGESGLTYDGTGLSISSSGSITTIENSSNKPFALVSHATSATIQNYADTYQFRSQNGGVDYLRIVGGTLDHFPNTNGTTATFFGANDDGQALYLDISDASNYTALYAPDVNDGGGVSYNTSFRLGHPTNSSLYTEINGSTGDVTVGGSISATNIPLYIEGTLSSAQILSLFSSPVTVISAPGAGQYIVIERVELSMDYNSTTYATGGNVQLEYTDGTNIVSDTDIDAFFISSADAFYANIPNNVRFSVFNLGVQFGSTASNPTTGNSDVDYRIWYYVRTL